MTGFIKLPYPGKERPTVISLSQIDTFFLDISSTPKRVFFRLKEITVEAVFETREQAKEWFEYISELITTK